MATPCSNPLSRRQFTELAARLAVACVASSGCRAVNEAAPSAARVSARPSSTASTGFTAGTHALSLGGARNAVLYLPGNAGDAPLPLIVLLHGAGGSGAGFLGHLSGAIDSLPAAILAPDSLAPTWDALRVAPHTVLDVITARRHRAEFGPDVTRLDLAFARVFDTVAVDPARVAIAGFSDGATYALSLGLANGDLFRRIVAFSPGFVVEGKRHGQPEIFVSHGRSDEVLPIDRCSRRIVPHLQALGYSTTYREFDGGHEVPEAISREALTWAAGGSEMIALRLH
jgi:predicted esterase